jgi:hypothetical protein
MTARTDFGISIPDPPRAVPPHLYLRRARAMFFVGLIFTIVGPAAAVALLAATSATGAGISPFTDLLLNRSHSTVIATVLAKKLITSVHAGSEHPWRIDFHFERPDGKAVTAWGYTYDQELGNHLTPGDPIEVEYDPADPSRVRPVGGYAQPTPLWVSLLVLGLLGVQALIGAGMMAGAMLLARRQQKLLAYGVGTEAEVLQVRCVKSINFGSKHPYDVHYRFRDQYGASVVGRNRTYSYAWAEALVPGEKVGIVFNPCDPRENALWLHGKELEWLGGSSVRVEIGAS